MHVRINLNIYIAPFVLLESGGGHIVYQVGYRSLRLGRCIRIWTTFVPMDHGDIVSRSNQRAAAAAALAAAAPAAAVVIRQLQLYSSSHLVAVATAQAIRGGTCLHRLETRRRVT